MRFRTEYKAVTGRCKSGWGAHPGDRKALGAAERWGQSAQLLPKGRGDTARDGSEQGRAGGTGSPLQCTTRTQKAQRGVHRVGSGWGVAGGGGIPQTFCATATKIHAHFKTFCKQTWHEHGG